LQSLGEPQVLRLFRGGNILFDFTVGNKYNMAIRISRANVNRNEKRTGHDPQALGQDAERALKIAREVAAWMKTQV